MVSRARLRIFARCRLLLSRLAVFWAGVSSRLLLALTTVAAATTTATTTTSSAAVAGAFTISWTTLLVIGRSSAACCSFRCLSLLLLAVVPLTGSALVAFLTIAPCLALPACRPLVPLLAFLTLTVIGALTSLRALGSGILPFFARWLILTAAAVIAAIVAGDAAMRSGFSRCRSAATGLLPVWSRFFSFGGLGLFADKQATQTLKEGGQASAVFCCWCGGRIRMCRSWRCRCHALHGRALNTSPILLHGLRQFFDLGFRDQFITSFVATGVIVAYPFDLIGRRF